MLIRTLTAVAVLVAAMTLAGSSQARSNDGYHSQIARTTGLTATFRYFQQPDQHRFSKASVTIKRAGGVTFVNALRPLRPGYDVAPSFVAGGGRQAIHIVRLDRSAEPEVVVDLYSGGAHCCFYTTVFRYDPAARNYSRISHLWGNPSPELQDLNGDRLPEFVSGDDRFAYAFTSYADSAFPIQIWRFEGGRFRDTTRSFPAAIRQQSNGVLQSYMSLRTSSSSVRGILAAYLADKYLLGEQTEGWAVLKNAAARGYLSHQYDVPDSASVYLVKLKAFLAKNGYGR